MLLKLTTSTILGLFAFSIAWADELGAGSEKFYEEVTSYTQACENEDACSGPYRNQVLYSQSRQINRLANSTEEALKRISFEQAQIWGDTILEGDYAADGATRLDKVLAFFKGDHLIGYKIQYSEKAWYTGQCDYDGRPETLENCAQGRIHESSFVSADLETYFTDENDPADFAFETK